LGWRHWSVLTHNSIIENIFLLFFIALRDKLFTTSFIFDLILFLLFSIFSTTYGYLINDIADRELDKLHGKNNTFENDSYTKAILIVLLFLILSILFGFRFLGNPLFIPLWICWGLAATFYSLPPVRLKERGKTGLIVVVLAQRVLPTLLIFAAFKHYAWVDLIVFTAYIFFRGLSSDLNHQLSDYQNDFLTKTDTFAVEAGKIKAQKIFRYSLEMEKVLLLFCLVIMCVETPHIDIYGISPIIPVLIAYLFLYGLCQMKIRSLESYSDANPFVPVRKNIFQFIHHAFPSVILPFYLLLLLVYEKWLFFPILLVFGLLRNMYSLEAIKNTYPIKKITEAMKGCGLQI
jgi:4-hydroxybenzoate polyprenyltransferase